jgi:uncharacterized protein YdhG (YjbR/CyaY superfamily)
MRPSFASVQDYLAALEPSQSRALRRVLTLVRKTVPGSTRVISYGIPAFRQDRVFIYCAAFKRHIGIYPPLRTDMRLQAALKPFANAKGNLAFPLDEPLPLPLIARLAKALASQQTRSDAEPKRRARRKGAGAA